MIPIERKYRLALKVIQDKVDEQSNNGALWEQPYGRNRTLLETDLLRELTILHDTIERLTIPLLESNLYLVRDELKEIPENDRA